MAQPGDMLGSTVAICQCIEEVLGKGYVSF
jgi:hypothetical protein